MIDKLSSNRKHFLDKNRKRGREDRHVQNALHSMADRALTKYDPNRTALVKYAGQDYPSAKKKEDAERIPFARKPLMIGPGFAQVQIKTFVGTSNNVVFASAAGASTGTLLLLNGIIRGVQDGQHVGRRINMVRLRLKGVITPVGSVTVATDSGGMYSIVYDRSPNAAQCTYGDIFQDVFGNTTRSSLTPENPNYEGRFLVMKRVGQIHPYYTVAAAKVSGMTWRDNISTSANVNINIPMQQLLTVYNSTNGVTAASINTGALYLVLTGPGAYQFVTLGWNLTYADM